jgi:formylglycine-generating enzyme required for sulfatase activity
MTRSRSSASAIAPPTVQDCIVTNYVGAPSDGSAVSGPSSCPRVNRGGSWFNGPEFLRSAARDSDAPSNRANFLGFRLARTLP